MSGDSIASCSGDKTVRVWRRHGASDTWICAAILEETHHRSIRCSSWSPDGRYLATASFDATTAIWEVQASHLTTITCLHMQSRGHTHVGCREAPGNRLHCLKGMRARSRVLHGVRQVLTFQVMYSAHDSGESVHTTEAKACCDSSLCKVLLGVM